MSDMTDREALITAVEILNTVADHTPKIFRDEILTAVDLSDSAYRDMMATLERMAGGRKYD